MELSQKQKEKVKESLVCVNAENSLIELFDEIYEPIVFGCLTYCASNVLSSVDPIAWREEIFTHSNNMCEENIWIEVDGNVYEFDEVKNLLEEENETKT